MPFYMVLMFTSSLLYCIRCTLASQAQRWIKHCILAMISSLEHVLYVHGGFCFYSNRGRMLLLCRKVAHWSFLSLRCHHIAVAWGIWHVLHHKTVSILVSTKLKYYSLFVNKSGNLQTFPYFCCHYFETYRYTSLSWSLVGSYIQDNIWFLNANIGC